MFTLPDLPYDYDALSKSISKEIMQLHHDKHHQAYVDNLNKAIDAEPSLKDKSIDELLTSLDSIPESVRTTVRNHGGGHYNHSQFWKFMSPDGGGQPSDAKLLSAIKDKYSDYQGFVDKFSEAALKVFGSGWVWLAKDLSIVPTPLQDNPIMKGESAPILGLDVWEHAYYLDYKSNRADYIKAWWDVVNWPEVESRY